MTTSKYVYCFVDVDADTQEGASLGTGVADEPVHLQVKNGIGIVVHDCASEAYDTDDAELAKTWIKQHNSTIERARNEFGTPLPMTFDTIFESEDALRTFVADNRHHVQHRLEVLAGMEEFGVRIYCEKRVLVDEADAPDEATESGGMAYFEQKKQEQRQQKELANNIKARFQTYFTHIDDAVTEIVEEDLEDEPDDDRGYNVLKASCLASAEETDGLKQALDEINAEDGVEVVFTGPWAPYSFAGAIGNEE